MEHKNIYAHLTPNKNISKTKNKIKSCIRIRDEPNGVHCEKDTEKELLRTFQNFLETGQFMPGSEI